MELPLYLSLDDGMLFCRYGSCKSLISYILIIVNIQ